MSPKQSRLLYLATIEALQSNASSLINMSDHDAANGLALWKRLDEHYLNLHSNNYILNRKLQDDYSNFVKQPKESFDMYYMRFQECIESLLRNGIQPDPIQAQAVKMVMGLNMPSVFKQYILDINSIKSKTENKSLRDIMDEVKTLYHSNAEVEKWSSHSKSPSASPTDIPQTSSIHTNSRPGMSGINSALQQTTTPPSRTTADQSALTTLRNRLRQNNDKKAVLTHIHSTYNSSCPIHPSSATHTFLQCHTVERVCRECNSIQSLEELRRQHNVFPAANRQSSRQPSTSPAPAPTSTAHPTAPTSSPAPTPPHSETARLMRAVDDLAARLDSLTHLQDSSRVSFADPVHQMVEESNVENNNINNDSLRYCPSVSSLSYRITAKAYYAPSSTSFSPTSNKAVLDSGATHNMSSDLSLFETLSKYGEKDLKEEQPCVLMGDDTTTVPIVGYGIIKFSLCNKTVRMPCLYVPSLGTTLLSMKQHMQNKGCYFHAEAGKTVLAFPTFLIHPSVDKEIEVGLSPSSSNNIEFDALTAEKLTTHQRQHSENFQEEKSVTLISPHITTYLPSPRDYRQFSDVVKIKKLTPDANIPSRATTGSIGFDVQSIKTTTIQPGEVVKLPTGLSTAFPKSMYLRIAPRSSLSSMNITVEGGVVDSDYRGEIKVMLRNNGSTAFVIPKGHKIAQFIFERANIPLLEITATLPQSVRNEGGFGHTDEPKCKRSRITTYRLDSNTLVIIDRKNKSHFRARKIIFDDSNKPIHQTSINEGSPINIINLNSNDSQTPHSDDDDSSVCAALHPPDVNNPTDMTPVDPSKINKSLPQKISISRDYLLKSIGHRDTTLFLNSLQTISTKSLSVVPEWQDKDITDQGSSATMSSRRRNQSPSEPPPSYSDIWHMDIGFGPCTSIGGFRYTLMLVDKATRYKFVYGLKNLKSSLSKAIHKFLRSVGRIPQLIRTDFDTKLIGEKIENIFLQKNIRLEAAPPHRQHQNGLVERHWRTVVSMARNWLTSSMLPSKYWFFAVKRAVEVCNILPTKHLDTITTPYELVFKKQVDYRQLFPMFSVAYIKQVRETGGNHKNKWLSQSLKCICVGKCPHSDALLFYHPPSRQTISCADNYKFDTITPPGPHFGEKYDGNFFLTTSPSMQDLHITPTHEENSTIYIKTSTTPIAYTQATVLSIPLDESNEPYTLQEKQSGNIVQHLASELIDHDPTSAPIEEPTDKSPFPHIPWIKSGARATIYLQDRMLEPKQGYLLRQENHQWVFAQGRSKTPHPSKLISLPNFQELAQSLLYNNKLFQGWKSKQTVLNARHARATSNILSHLIIARKISAKNLHQQQAPTLLKHHLLHPDDKETWDMAYREEYEGLVNIDSWEMITENDYQALKHTYKGVMPTMAIATIKRDGDGNPVRAKYRIVALGNLDPHDWAKHDCFAPVLSQFELRFLIALAVKLKRIPKTGDVSQAFVQSFLPLGENYICTPPAGCPLTPKGMYLRLKKTLYGLKRSPRHFYDLAKKTLLSIGMKQHPSSPNIFSGVLLPGKPPLYLGLFVDDFIYYSESDEVEKEFERNFGSKMKMEFNGPLDYFLGINFDCKQSPDGEVSILMTQEAFVDQLLTMTNLHDPSVNPVTTPYRSGFPVDSIPVSSEINPNQDKLTKQMQSIIGCLNWLSTSTRPDISTITNILAKYCSNPTQQHLDHAKYVIKYLKGTRTKGIEFSSANTGELQSHVKFPVDPSSVLSLSDANWGPQDQSKPKEGESRSLDLFKSRSLSGFLIWFGGPLHWSSKRQTVTARSSAEAEIYATDECTKSLLHLSQMVAGLNLTEAIMPPPTTIYNDNNACVCWSQNMTTKGLRHIQIRENAVRESVQSGFITVRHIAGAINLSDMFTKEDKDTAHFLRIRDIVMSSKESFQRRDRAFHH